MNNNVSTSSSAAASASAGHRRASLFRSFLRFVICSCIPLFGGVVVAASGSRNLGVAMSVLGTLMLIVGIPIYVIRFFMRILFG